MRLPSEEDIRQAIEVWEKKNWDFKAKEALGDPKLMQPKVVDEKDWELCRDIASFANTNGGYIVVGVEDDRKNRAVQGHAISDNLKSRISQVVRSKIAPLPSYDVDIVKVQGKGVTVFLIEEGDADLCTVNGTVFVRDLNGRAPASGAEITRIMRRRLGRKLNPVPTDREIMDSPYNLPRPWERKQAIVGDFLKVAPSRGFREIVRLDFRHGSVAYPIVALLSSKRREWYFAVIPHEANFGVLDYRRLSGFMGAEIEGLLKTTLPDSAGVYPLVLITGKIGTLNSQLRYFGFSFVPTRFGGYVGPGREKGHSALGDFYGHRFMLSGITSPEVMARRLDAFKDWLEEMQTKLSVAKKR